MSITTVTMNKLMKFFLPREKGTTGPWRTLCLRIPCPSLAARSTLQTPSEKVSTLRFTELCFTRHEHCNKTPFKILSQLASLLEPNTCSQKHGVHWTLQTEDWTICRKHFQRNRDLCTLTTGHVALVHFLLFYSLLDCGALTDASPCFTQVSVTEKGLIIRIVQHLFQYI